MSENGAVLVHRLGLACDPKGHAELATETDMLCLVLTVSSIDA
jgi:hypothetical protein